MPRTREKRSARSVLRRIGFTGSVARGTDRSAGQALRIRLVGGRKKYFRYRMVAMGPQDTYVVKMEHLVTRARVRGELAPFALGGSSPIPRAFLPARVGVIAGFPWSGSLDVDSFLGRGQGFANVVFEIWVGPSFDRNSLSGQARKNERGILSRNSGVSFRVADPWIQMLYPST